MILSLLAKNWWLVLLRGIVAIAFGILAFAWPSLTIIALAALYGVYALADGLFALTAAISGGGMLPRWWLALVGVSGLAAGLAAFFWPGGVALVLVLLIGSWSVAHGVMEIVGAIQLRKEISNEWMLILSGLLSVGLGVFLWARPGAGALALVWVIGAYAVVFGILMTLLSFRLKKYRSAIEER